MKVLITGADGYLGHRLARRYHEDGTPLLLWVRARDDAEFQTKKQHLASQFPGASFAWGDLSDKAPFAQLDPEGIERIVHGAAVTRFNVESGVADRVNVDGTRKLLDFAERCDRLESFGLVSTIYASGLTAGPIEEHLLPERPAFANHYERSKWECERLLQDRDLPWRVFRVATVIADDDAGRVTQQNAIHNTLKLLYYGLLSLVPGRPETPVYLVTGRFVVDALHALMAAPGDRSVFHLAHSGDDSITLDGFLDVVYEVFGETADFSSRRILRPIFTDEKAFDLLADGVRGFGGGVVNQALASVTPFARQLYIAKDLRNDRLQEALRAYEAPDARELVASASRYLVSTRWGRIDV